MKKANLFSVFGTHIRFIDDSKYAIVTVNHGEDDLVPCHRFLMNTETEEVIGPNVRNIEYINEENAFRLNDKLEINGEVTINIYFYITNNGELVNTIYNDYTDTLSMVDFNSDYEFTEYRIYKKELKKQILESIQERVQFHDENTKKFLRLMNKRDDI